MAIIRRSQLNTSLYIQVGLRAFFGFHVSLTGVDLSVEKWCQFLSCIPDPFSFHPFTAFSSSTFVTSREFQNQYQVHWRGQRPRRPSHLSYGPEPDDQRFGLRLLPRFTVRAAPCRCYQDERV